MGRIAVMITDMFEDSEYAAPAKAFREAGHTVVHIGLRAGEINRPPALQTQRSQRTYG